MYDKRKLDVGRFIYLRGKGYNNVVIAKELSVSSVAVNNFCQKLRLITDEEYVRLLMTKFINVYKEDVKSE